MTDDKWQEYVNTPEVVDKIKAAYNKLRDEEFEHACREVACLDDAQWEELKQEENQRRADRGAKR